MNSPRKRILQLPRNVWSAVFLGRDRGQAVVECAFLIPVVLLVLMMLIQPGILLYNYMVMNAAAAEGCRLLATKTAVSTSEEVYEDTVRRHLGSIPQQENFHVHQSGCSWVISMEGSEESITVSVSIENQIKPLPFFDFGSRVLGLTNAEGNFVQEVQVERDVYSAWVAQSEDGISPRDWVSRDERNFKEG